MTLVDIELVEQFQVEITQWSGLFEYGVGLMAIAASRHDGGKIIAGVIGGIAEVAADDHSRMVTPNPIPMKAVRLG